MARTINEVPIDMTGESGTPEVRLRLNPLTPEESTPAERAYADIRVFTARDVDDKKTQFRLDVHIGDDDVSTFNPGDSAALLQLANKLVNHLIAVKNL